MKVYMAIDPETRRVFISEDPLTRDSFPPGLRGEGWPQREITVDKRRFRKLLRGESGGVSGEDQDRFHRDLWDQARGKDEPLWPLLPVARDTPA